MSIENQRFCSNGVSLTQNFRYKGSLPPTILLVRKPGHLSCGITMWAQVSFVLSQITCSTDGQTAFSWLYYALHYIFTRSRTVTSYASCISLAILGHDVMCCGMPLTALGLVIDSMTVCSTVHISGLFVKMFMKLSPSLTQQTTMTGNLIV